MATKKNDKKDMEECECSCNYGFVILTIILATLSLYTLANAFIIQFNHAAGVLTIMGWYLAAIILLVITKASKWRIYTCCDMHKRRY